MHSPLVGASSWSPAARALEERGYQCDVPAVPGLVPWSRWADAASAAVTRREEELVVVGHSAAGLALPAIAATIDAAALVFVDARIPPDRGRVAPADDGFLEFLVGLADDTGVLPPWSQWWGPDVMEQIIVDGNARAAFERDLPRLPLAWFDDTSEVPPWTARPAGYLQLSPLFSTEADLAFERGWPTRRLDGTHVHPITHPLAVATAIDAIIRSLG